MRMYFHLIFCIISSRWTIRIDLKIDTQQIELKTKDVLYDCSIEVLLVE